MNLEQTKQFVWDLWYPMRAESPIFIPPDKLAYHIDVEFHGFSPVGSLNGRDALFDCLYKPLVDSLIITYHHPYMFLGGKWKGDNWVAITGDICGILYDRLFGVPATNQPVRIRFGEFLKVRDRKIVEVRLLIDIPSLAAQAGHNLFSAFHDQFDTPPAPMQRNGICIGKQSEMETNVTLKLVEDMLTGCNQLNDSDLESMGMSRFWHRDMVWYGPWGIGTCRGFGEFQKKAQGPSVASFPNRRGGFHQARIADGVTAAFTGWPSLRGEFTGEPFLGIQPTGGQIGQNLMDFYVRRDNKLLENWVLIDLIDFAEQCGVKLTDQLELD